MNQLKRLDQVYHRLLFLSYSVALPADMESFMQLNPLDQKIMSMIFEHDSISISTLTKLLNKSKSTMTSAIKRLEKKKLIERTLSQSDKRISVLQLTAEGILLQNGHLKYEDELFNSILSALDDMTERDHFLASLEKIVNKFEKKI